MSREKISKHSKSFAWLFGIAFVGAFLALWASGQFESPAANFFSRDGYQVISYQPRGISSDAQSKTVVDTSDWQEYSNKKYGLKFKYDPEWQIRSINNRDGFYVIEIDPGLRYDNFRVFISEDDYFALSGVPVQKTLVAGKEALNLDGAVLGIKDNATYFTFDMGASLSLKPYFQAMVETVEFKKPD